MHPPGMPGYIIRSLQLVFSIIVLSLAAALVANQPSGGSPSQINYSVFVGVFALLTWFFSVIVSTLLSDGLGSPVILLALDSLNALFFFCGGVAMATALRVHSCGNIAFVITNKIVAGSTQRCHEAQALTAFLWFGMLTSFSGSRLMLVGFAAYVVSAILTGILSDGASVRRRGVGVVSPMRSV
jgi:hypothetical protein